MNETKARDDAATPIRKRTVLVGIVIMRSSVAGVGCVGLAIVPPCMVGFVVVVAAVGGIKGVVRVGVCRWRRRRIAFLARGARTSRHEGGERGWWWLLVRNRRGQHESFADSATSALHASFFSDLSLNFFFSSFIPLEILTMPSQYFER